MDEKFLEGVIRIQETMMRETGTRLLKLEDMKRDLAQTKAPFDKGLVRVACAVEGLLLEVILRDYSMASNRMKVAEELRQAGRETWEEIPGGGVFPLASQLMDGIREKVWRYIREDIAASGHELNLPLGLRVVEGQVVLAFYRPDNAQQQILQDPRDLILRLAQIAQGGDGPEEPQLVAIPDAPAAFVSEGDVDLAAWDPSKTRVQ